MSKKPFKPTEDMPENPNSIEWLIYGTGKKILNKDVVRAMAEIDVSDNKIAEFFGMDVSTLRANYSGTIGEGKLAREIKLKLKQYHVAVEKENPQMLIHLGKHELGQSDKVETHVEIKQTQFFNLPNEVLDDIMNKVLENNRQDRLANSILIEHDPNDFH